MVPKIIVEIISEDIVWDKGLTRCGVGDYDHYDVDGHDKSNTRLTLAVM